MARRKKNEDQSPENTDNINSESDDSFGLPEVEYEPLKRDEPESSTSGESTSSYEEVNEQSEEESVQEETIEEPSYRPSYEEEEERQSVLPKVLVVLLIL